MRGEGVRAQGRERRTPFLAGPTLLLASLSSAGLGFYGLTLWPQARLLLATAQAEGAHPYALIAVQALLMAGPWIALASVLIGWTVFFARRPGAGVMWVFLPPVIWVCAVMAYLAITTMFCDGLVTCGV